jgi:dihydrofolate reductase/uncharacterized protein YhbP (UPF0306 family)
MRRGRIIWHVTMSLDGFIAGVDDAMDWVFGWPGPNPVADEVVANIGAIVVGRRTYEVEDRQRGGFYGSAWKGPFFVLTHRPPATVPDWMTGTFVDADIDDAVARARTAAGDRNVVLFGADVARQAIERGLLDEIVVHLAPVLLGDGVRLFDVPGGARIDLEPTGVTTSGQVTNLRFRVARPEPAAVGRAIVEAGRYMTVGTADESGQPWVSPVWYAHQDCREFFWVSDPDARHSRNVAARPQVSIVIFDTNAPVGTGRGVYVTALAEQLTGDELERGIAVFSRRSQAQGAAVWTRDDVLPPARLRLYRAIASEHYVGEHDVRTQVQL